MMMIYDQTSIRVSLPLYHGVFKPSISIAIAQILLSTSISIAFAQMLLSTSISIAIAQMPLSTSVSLLSILARHFKLVGFFCFSSSRPIYLVIEYMPSFAITCLSQIMVSLNSLVFTILLLTYCNLDRNEKGTGYS